MDGSAILAMRNEFKGPVTVPNPTGQRIFIPEGWTEPKESIAKPEALSVSTLSAVVEYLAANRDGLDLLRLVVIVGSPRRVDVLDACELNVQFRRSRWLVAEALLPSISWGNFADAEQFIIFLQTCFERTDALVQLINLMGAIRENSVRETTDDGLSQEVKTQRGLHLKDDAKVPSPVLLKPYRSFLEVPQVESPFVVRMKEAAHGTKPEATLFEADAGKWRLDAVKNVGEHLRKELAAKKVPVPVLW